MRFVLFALGVRYFDQALGRFAVFFQKGSKTGRSGRRGNDRVLFQKFDELRLAEQFREFRTQFVDNGLRCPARRGKAPPALARITAEPRLAKVGTFGSNGERLSADTARAFTLPASISPRKLPTPKRVTCTSLAASACAAGPPPLYGTPTIWVPHWLFSQRMNRSGKEPSPGGIVEPARLALRQYFQLVDGVGSQRRGSEHTLGEKNRRVTGAKSVSGLYGSLSNSSGL